MFDDSSMRVWIATGALAVVILAGAVGFAVKKRNAPPEEPTQIFMAAPATPTPAAPKAAPLEPQAAAPRPRAAPQVAVPTVTAHKKEEAAELVLDRLAGTLSLSMPDIAGENNRLPLTYTCHRLNITPPLSWSKAPRATKTYVLFMEERQTGETPSLHWALFNIPVTAKGLPADLPRGRTELADGTRFAQNDNGVADYAGPCAPRGIYKYAFRLFALDTALNVAPGATRNDLIRAMNGHVIDAAEVPFVHYLRM